MSVHAYDDMTISVGHWSITLRPWVLMLNVSLVTAGDQNNVYSREHLLSVYDVTIVDLIMYY
jgi:hypothetical protein